VAAFYIWRRKKILTLEFHVDYWNDLVQRVAGNWKDPFKRTKKPGVGAQPCPATFS
tara:strand:+ start:2060 stop:2227 length:168 start_codon:yes stop_codon:yes gene_type:complete